MPDNQPAQITTPKPGEFIWYGRFRNRPAIVTKVFVDPKGAAKFEFEPVPKGRKKSKVRNLLPFKAMNPEDAAKYKKLYDEETKKMREKKASEQLQALKIVARYHQAYSAKLWPAAVAAIHRYEVLYQDAMALKDPLTEEGKATLVKFNLDNIEAWPRFPKNDFGAWMAQCYEGPLSGYSSSGPHSVLNGRASLADYQASLSKEHEAVQAILDSTGPERFTYKGFKIYNPDRMSDQLSLRVLEAIDYVVALFKKRGISLALLREGLAAIYIEPTVGSLNGKNAAGTYLWGVIQLGASALRVDGNMLDRFMNEVFLHEFGHHVHEYVLPKEAKSAWDQPWDAHDEVQERAKVMHMQTSAKERERWFALLEKTKFDVSKAAARLKGLEKLKFGAWLRQDMWKNPLIKPKRFQLTERGEAVFSLLRKFQEDPEKAALDEFRGINYSPEELARRGEDIVDTYKGWLGVGQHWRHNVDLQPELVQQLADADPAMGAALEKAKIELGVLKSTLVTDYAQTNKQEDFAETFVAFMGAPQKLTPESKFRMQRTLSLAGLYGKPIMKLAKMTTLDSSAIQKLRKDLLILLKNTPNVDTYSKGAKLRDGFKVYRTNFNRVFFEYFLNHDLKDTDELSESDKAYLDKKLRKIGWDFYADLTFPMPYPNEYVSEGAALQRFKEEAPKWANRVKAKARAFWGAMDDAIAYYTQVTSKPGFEVEVPTEERVSMEGFDVLVVGYKHGIDADYNGLSDSTDDMMAKFRAGLKHFKSRASQVLPLMLKAMVPLHVISYVRKIDEGGMYHGRYIEIALFGFMEFKNKNQMAQVLAHEMGHHLHKNYLSAADRKFWDVAIRGNYGPIDVQKALQLWPDGVWAYEMAQKLKDVDPVLAIQIQLIGWGHGGDPKPQTKEEFQTLVDSGHKFSVPTNPISAYAGKNSEEAFCEAIGNLVGYGPRTVDPLVQSWLKMIIPSVKIAAGLPDLVGDSYRGCGITPASALNVLRRFSMEHATPEARQKYLHEHPKAKPANHTVGEKVQRAPKRDEPPAADPFHASDRSAVIKAHQSDFDSLRDKHADAKSFSSERAKRDGTEELLNREFSKMTAPEKTVLLGGHELGKKFEATMSKADATMHAHYFDRWRTSAGAYDYKGNGALEDLELTSCKLQGLASAFGFKGSLAPEDKELDKDGAVTKARKQGATDKKLQAYAKKMYDYQQAYFEHAGIKELTLYRGVKFPETNKADEGSKVQVESREMASFTMDPAVAAHFGRVIKFKVPVRNVFASSLVRPNLGSESNREDGGCFHEAEVIVMGASELTGETIGNQRSDDE